MNRIFWVTLRTFDVTFMTSVAMAVIVTLVSMSIATFMRFAFVIV